MGTYTDWTKHLDFIPDKHKKNILELGCGVGTEILCEQFKMVFSFETWMDDEWYRKTVDKITSDNWSHFFRPLSHYGLHRRYERDNRQVLAFKKYTDTLMRWIDLSQINVVFVDQGFYMRGESVNFFMRKNVPTIFAHDTNKRLAGSGYGWHLTKEKSFKYNTHTFREGCGVKFYFK